MKIFAKGWSMNKDGPGNRLIYYLKGCNLRCLWCASPESISAADELLFYPDRAAGTSLDFLCPHGAVSGTSLDRSICASCPDLFCRTFRHRAIEWAGQEIAPEVLEQDITSAAGAWGNFAGVTFGGGEPSLQSGELVPLIRKLNDRNIHTAVESNAAAPGFRDIADHVRLVITDLKAGTPENFLHCTGGKLETVTANHRYAARHAAGLLIRIPLIPTLNDHDTELSAMAAILQQLNGIRLEYHGSPLQVELLKLHHFGQAKYSALDRPYPAAGLPPVAPEKITALISMLASCGIQAREG